LSLGGIASIRPSVYLSRFYKSMRSKLIYSKKLKNRSVFDYLFSAPFYLLFLINDISLYRPMRNEEMIANDEAILMGYGDALRTYYYEISRRQIKKDLMDKEHPSIRKMIEKMNQTMGIDDPMLKDVYVRHGKVVYVDQYYSNASKREKEIKYWLNSEIQRVDVYHRLAFLYFNQGQCREDEKQLAIENYQKAIDLGDGLACYKLAQLYEKVGSFDLAINAYEKGVEMNDLNSILMLAEWYKKGIHIEKDLDSSYKMYLKGAELGNLLSIFYRDYINLSFKSYAYEYKGESFNYDKRLIEIMLDGTIKETIDDENGTQLNVHQYRKKGQMLYVYDSEKQYKRYVIVLKNQGLKIKHIQFEDNKFVDILFKKVEE
jgi:TPR repeat protein